MTVGSSRSFSRCYVDESIHEDHDVVVTAFVFASQSVETSVAQVLRRAGLMPRKEEHKSRARMDSNPALRQVRKNLLELAGNETQLAVFFGPYDRPALGKQSLQALQTTIVRNGIRPSRLRVYFDRGIFPTAKEASRLHSMFYSIRACRIRSQEDSHRRLGIQLADAVAHSFGQILKEHLTGNKKMVKIGGRGTGYPKGTKAPLGWHLLTTLRHGLFTRPVVCGGERYNAATDPVVLDPLNDDIVVYSQHPALLGWGVQIDPEAEDVLRRAVEEVFGRVWLGCVH